MSTIDVPVKHRVPLADKGTMIMNEFLTNLAHYSGGIVTQQGNTPILTLPGTPEITIRRDMNTSGAYLSANLLEIPEQHSERLAMRFLKENLYGVLPGGSAAFAYNAGEGILVLWERINEENAEPAIMRQITLFRNAVSHWLKRIDDDELDA